MIQRFERSDAIEIRNGIMFEFLPRTANMYVVSLYTHSKFQIASFPGPSITANTVEGLVKLLRRMASGGRLEAWHFR